MKLLPILGKMKDLGIQTNQDYIRRGLSYENECTRKAKEEFRRETGHVFSDSRTLFKKIFDARGEKFPTTAKGNASFTAEVLEGLNTPTARAIVRVRESEKRAGTYWSSFIHYADESGVIRANFQSSATVSGRFSCRDPNLQNLPSEDEPDDAGKEFIIRGSFIPREKKAAISIDFQAIEYRVFLDLAGEHSLIAAVNAGEDLHQATANMMGVSRKFAKTLGFMLLYGGGTAALASSLGVSIGDAKALKDLYFARLPKVKGMIRAIISTAESRGYIRNFLGRRCWLSNFDFSYKMPNALIQSSAADILKIAMSRIGGADLPGVGMLATIHDELWFEIDEDKLDQVAKIKDLMEGVYRPQNGLPMVASPSISRRSFAKRDFEGFHA